MLNAETQRHSDAERPEDLLTDQIINAAIEVHRVLGGPGLLESLYEEALCHELHLRGFHVESQVQVPVRYKNRVLRDPMRMDVLVNRMVILEIKATEQIHQVHKAQILTYLKLTGLNVGLVLNFGQGRLVDGIMRTVNHF